MFPHAAVDTVEAALTVHSGAAAAPDQSEMDRRTADRLTRLPDTVLSPV